MKTQHSESQNGTRSIPGGLPCMLVLLVLLAGEGFGQSSLSRKTHAVHKAAINFSSELAGGLKLSHNGPEAILKEVLDTNIISLIAQSAGITKTELAMLGISPSVIKTEIWLSCISTQGLAAYDRFGERLVLYVRERIDGHTKECLLTGLTNRVGPDVDLQWFAANYPILPTTWLKKAQPSLRTNTPAQTPSKWLSFELVDGEIAWNYMLEFGSTGDLVNTSQMKFDAKDVDPNLKESFAALDKEIADEMKRLGSSGQFGAVHSYWRLKKERLKSRGIDWRSPGELNSGIVFD